MLVWRTGNVQVIVFSRNTWPCQVWVYILFLEHTGEGIDPYRKIIFAYLGHNQDAGVVPAIVLSTWADIDTANSSQLSHQYELNKR